MLTEPGLMWSYFLFLVRTIAAAFWTICGLIIKCAVSAFDIASIGLSLDIFLR